MIDPIRPLEKAFDVSPLLAEIEAHPDVWNRHGLRKQAYAHASMSDIWVRYNDWSNFNGDGQEFNGPHESVWYPVITEIPAVVDLCNDVMDFVKGIDLGGVLITRIPPGGRVEPHIDLGWHAQHYEKFAVQLMGNKDQAFHFEGAHLSALPGEIYTFDNSQLHWVTNDSDTDRMTIIICIRGASH
jgi:hypothetical protein